MSFCFHIVLLSVLSLSNFFYQKVKNIFIQEALIRRLTFNPGHVSWVIEQLGPGDIFLTEEGERSLPMQTIVFFLLMSHAVHLTVHYMTTAIN